MAIVSPLVNWYSISATGITYLFPVHLWKLDVIIGSAFSKYELFTLVISYWTITF